MEIVTNWVPRELVSLYDLPAEEQFEFEYVDEGDYSLRFVKYKGVWYDVYDTQTIDPVKPGENTSYMAWGMKVHPGSPLAQFDNIISDSYFSGVLFKITDDDRVIVGHYFC